MKLSKRELAFNAARESLLSGHRPGLTPAQPVCLGSGLVALDAIYNNENGNPQFFAGGSCCNVLTVLSYLGWSSFPMARLGKDPEGDRIIEDMKRWRVKTKFVEQDPKIPSPRIIERVFDGRRPHHRFYLKCAHGSWLPRRRPFLLKSLESIQDKMPKSDVFYFDRASPSALKTAKILKKQGAVIVFEPPRLLHGDVFARCLKIADIVKHCYRQSHKDTQPDVKIPLEIQTKGADGLRYRAEFLGYEDWKEMEAFPVLNLVDAAGSGDWLTAGLIHALEKSGTKHTPTIKKLESSLKFGQALASLNCSFTGARGMMYSLKRSHLLSLARKTIADNKSPAAVIPANLEAGLTTSLSSKCKVCLCSNQELTSEM